MGQLEQQIAHFFENRPRNNAGKWFPGEIIPQTGGAYKLRYAPVGSPRGLSGSYPIIYFVMGERALTFLEIYDKHQQVSLSSREKAALRRLSGQLKRKD